MLKQGDKALYMDYKHKPYKEVVVFDATATQLGAYVDGRYINFDAKTNRSKHTYTGYGHIYEDTAENRKMLEDAYNKTKYLTFFSIQNVEALPVNALKEIKELIQKLLVENNVPIV